MTRPLANCLLAAFVPAAVLVYAALLYTHPLATVSAGFVVLAAMAGVRRGTKRRAVELPRAEVRR